MSLSELKQELRNCIDTSEINELCFQVEKTDNIELAFSLYHNDKVKEYNKSILLLHIARLTAKTNLYKALDYVSVLDKKSWAHDISLIKYNKAKSIVDTDLDEALRIIDSISDEKFNLGFRAYLASRVLDLDKINELLDELDTMKEFYEYEDDRLDHFILYIANEIAPFFPEFANSLLDKLHENWIEIVDVKESIAIAMYKKDINSTCNFIKTIDHSFAQFYTILEVLEVCENKKDIPRLIEFVEEFELIEFKYRVFYKIQKKFGIDLSEKIRNTAIQMSPYDDVEFDIDALSIFCQEKLLPAYMYIPIPNI